MVSSAAQNTGPAMTVGPTGCSANRNELTTPKFPPPPRSAQNRSGCSSADARTMLPSAVTTSASSEVVDGEPVLAHEEADAAAEREPGDAGVADDAARGGQTVRLRLVVDVAPQGTALHAGRALDGIDRDGAHRREVDHDSVVAHRGAGHVVAPASYGDLQVAVAGEAHRRGHVGHARAAGDAGRMAVDRAIPDPAGSVVAGARRQQQLSAERSAELVERDRLQGRCLWCLDGGHLVLPAVLDEPQRRLAGPG